MPEVGVRIMRNAAYLAYAAATRNAAQRSLCLFFEVVNINKDYLYIDSIYFQEKAKLCV